MALFQQTHSIFQKLSLVTLSLSISITSFVTEANEPPSLQPQMVFSSYFNKKDISYVLTYWPLVFRDYEKGLNRLKEYYDARLTEASEEDKYFLMSEYKVLQRELKNTARSYDEFFEVIQLRVKRFKRFESLFSATTGMKLRHAIQDADNQYKVVKLVNDTRRAEKLSDKASAEMEYQLGNVAFDNLDFKRALQHYQNAVKFNRGESSYLQALGQILHLLGEKDVAQQFIKQAKQLNKPIMLKQTAQ